MPPKAVPRLTGRPVARPASRPAVREEVYEARFGQSQLFTSLIAAMESIIIEFNMDINALGISMQAKDSSGVLLVAFVLPVTLFEKFKCSRPVTLGLAMGGLMKIIKCIGKEEILTIRGRCQGDVIEFITECGDNTATYTLNLMDIDAEHLGIPDSDPDAALRMSSREFSRLCKSHETLGSDVITFTCVKNAFSIASVNEALSGNQTIKCASAGGDNDEDAAVSKPVMAFAQSVRGSFSLRYMMSFCKAAPLSNLVYVDLSRGTPIRIKFPLPDGHMTFFLAPKINEDSTNDQDNPDNDPVPQRDDTTSGYFQEEQEGQEEEEEEVDDNGQRGQYVAEDCSDEEPEAVRAPESSNKRRRVV